MSSDDPALQPVIVLRVVIRSPDLDTFVAKYSRFIKDDRIFIFTKSSQPTGTRVRFTLELSDGQTLIHGEGTVTRIRPDGGDPSKPPGMELKFVPLDEGSRHLVDRMLKAREATGQFREETTDVQTKIRDGAAAPATRDFDEAPPSLPPLQKTGALPSVSELPSPRQDESGAVTLAQAPPGTRAAEERAAATRPSGGFHAPPTDPGPPPSASTDQQSGGFSTPTPLPAPIPASESEEFGVRRELATTPPARLDKPSPPGARDAGTDAEGPFAALGPAPSFAEAFRAPLPGGHSSTPPTGTVPANPFSEVSDGAIEYFVEWSLEQSTAPKPKVAEASFANVAMATPRAERRRSARGPLLAGMAIGIFLGLPLGGAVVWYARPLPPPVIVEKMPEPPPSTLAAVDMTALAPASRDAAATATATPKPSAPTLPPTAKPAASEQATAAAPTAKPAEAELQVTSKPPGAAVSADGEARGRTPMTLSLTAGAHELTVTKERYAPVTQSVEAPGKLEVTLKRPTATLHVESDPPGGDVIVEGKPRGKTPVDVTLDAFHHYDVQVMLLGTRPWHKRVSLKPPQTDVVAKLSLVHTP